MLLLIDCYVIKVAKIDYILKLMIHVVLLILIHCVNLDIKIFVDI